MRFTLGFAGFIDRRIGAIDFCPWTAHAGIRMTAVRPANKPTTLYSLEQRRRRDASLWTLVQGILAPTQFVVFAVSLALVVSYLVTGEGAGIATASIVLKTLILYAIMITGSLWERDVFGQYLFAPAFFWEDVVSIGVLFLHTAYLFALVSGALDLHGQMLLALVAYAAYVGNATQFLLKLRAARIEGQRPKELSGLGTA